MDKDTKMIKQNYEILNSMKEIIRQENDLEEKVRLLKIASYFAVYNHTGLFSDRFLEEEMVKTACCIKTKNNGNFEENRFLHVATSVYGFGGHTRLIDRFIKFFKKGSKHSLILTKQDGKIPEWLKKTIKDKNGEIISQKGSDIQKAKFLREYSSDFQYIILHIHPFDVVPVLAYGSKNFKRPVVFYNHADHIFWIGVSISDVVLDLGEFGFNFTRERRGIRNNLILPVPIECKNKLNISKEEARNFVGLPKDRKIILSIGTPDKYKPIGKFNFIKKSFEIINQIKDSIVVVVGVSKKENVWRNAFEKSKGRIIPVGIVEKEKLIYYIKSADLYIESFPFGSSTSTLEVMSAGIPSISVKNENKLENWDIINKICVNLEDIVPSVKKILNSNRFDNQIFEEVRNTHCGDMWKEKAEEIFKSIPDKHSANLSFKSKMFLDEYDKYLFNLLNNDKKKLINLSSFVKLKSKNKIKILKIIYKHPKFFSSFNIFSL